MTVTQKETVKVDVQGIAKLWSVVKSLNLFRSASVVSRPVTPMGGTAIGSAIDQSAEHVDQELKAKIVNAGNDVRPMIHRPLRAMGTLITMSINAIVGFTKSVVSLAFDVAKVLARFGARAAVTIVGGIVVVGGGSLVGYWLLRNLIFPLSKMAITLKIAQASFGWARDQAEDAMRIAAYHARYRFKFGKTDAALRATEERLAAMTDIIGGDIDGLQTTITQKMTDFRLGKGVMGDKDVFRRWGITPEMMKVRQQMGESDPLGWLEFFVEKKERLEWAIERLPPGPERERLIRARAKLGDDTLKIFGKAFSERAVNWTSKDIKSVRLKVADAVRLGFVTDAKQKAIDFDMAVHGVTRTLSELAQGIGGDIQPELTRILERWRIQFIDVERGGKGVGRELRFLGVEIFAKTWEFIGHLIKGIAPGIKRFALAWSQWLSNADEQKIARFARTIGFIEKVITFNLNMPDFLDPFVWLRGAYNILDSIAQVIFDFSNWVGKKTVDLFKEGWKLFSSSLDDMHDTVAAKMISWAENFEHVHNEGYVKTFKRGFASIINFFSSILRFVVPWASNFFISSAEASDLGGGVRDTGGFAGGPAVGPGGPAGITAPANTPIQRSGMAEVVSPSGRRFLVAEQYAANFQGFINDYEAAGGLIGPQSGTLGHRPNRSGHPIGMAIDINQIGYGIRGRGGRTLPVEKENELAAKWGLVSGANWRRPDYGHFGIRSHEAAQEALRKQGVPVPPPPMPRGKTSINEIRKNQEAALNRAANEAMKKEVAQIFLPLDSNDMQRVRRVADIHRARQLMYA